MVAVTAAVAACTLAVVLGTLSIAKMFVVSGTSSDSIGALLVIVDVGVSSISGSARDTKEVTRVLGVGATKFTIVFLSMTGAAATATSEGVVYESDGNTFVKIDVVSVDSKTVAESQTVACLLLLWTTLLTIYGVAYSCKGAISCSAERLL